MSHPELIALDAPVGQRAVDEFLPKLAAALDGSGPAILPLPAVSVAVRDRLHKAANHQTDMATGTSLVVPTSGSSGEPRLAMLSRDALIASAAATHEALGGGGRWLLALPTSHVAGLQVLTRSQVSGFPPVAMDLTDGFRTSALVDAVQLLLDDIGAEPRYASLVPTQLQRVVDAGGAAIAALMSLDAVLLGGGPAPGELVQQAHEAGITLVQTYGMTETCGGCVYDGVPLEGVEITLDRQCHVSIAGPMLFTGYLGDAERTHQVLQNGRLVTNDVGEFDEHGRLHITGRSDDVVVTGGHNVSCAVVERVIAKHPLVHDVVVLGQPDEKWGERVVAAVVAEPELTLDQLRLDVQDLLERHELPRELVSMSVLPFLDSGKPDRQAIRLMLRRQ